MKKFLLNAWRTATFTLGLGIGSIGMFFLIFILLFMASVYIPSSNLDTIDLMNRKIEVYHFDCEEPFGVIWSDDFTREELIKLCAMKHRDYERYNELMNYTAIPEIGLTIEQPKGNQGVIYRRGTQ